MGIHTNDIERGHILSTWVLTDELLDLGSGPETRWRPHWSVRRMDDNRKEFEV